MLQQAEAKREKERHSNIEFQEANIEDMNFPDQSFDAILCASALPYIQDIKKALKAYRQWLRQDGGVLSYNCPEATYTPLIPLMCELLSKRGLKGWRMPMGDMADADTHRKLLHDAGFASIQVERIVDSAIGMQWPQKEYAERGWNLMMGFNIWFRTDSLLSNEERDDLKEEFFACADKLGRNLADENGIVHDARTFIFAVGRT